MQQFTVPQFIDAEDKILGPITTRQFLIMVCSVLFAAFLYKFLYFSWALAIGLPQFFVCGIFAFYKVNEMPFHFFVLNFIQTLKRPMLRVWNNSFGKDYVINENEAVNTKSEVTEVSKRPHTKSRLNELALMVDTQGVYKGEESGKTTVISSKK